MILDPWCPEHGGRDPDLQLQQQRDDGQPDEQQEWHDYDPEC